MNEPVQGIPVSVLRKADPHKAVKLTVVRGLRGYEDESSNWAVDQLVKHLKRLSPEMEVADLYLPMFRILGGVSNDPEDDTFSPEDQFPALLEPLEGSDIIVISTRERMGFPDANVVRMFERLAEYARQKSKEHPGKTLFDDKPAAVIVTGGYGAYGASAAVSGALNKLGLTTCRHGLAFWDEKRGKPYKSDDFAGTLERMAVDLHDLCKALKQ